MSEAALNEAEATVYLTPDSVVIREDRPCPELEPERDNGASPILEGPTTRSGRKRKNPAAVKSAGKKKGKMSVSRTPPPKVDMSADLSLIHI